MNGQSPYQACVRCGNWVAIDPSTGTGVCPYCQTQNFAQGMAAPPPGAPGMAAPPPGAPGMAPPPPGAPGMMPPGMSGAPPAGSFSVQSGGTDHSYAPQAPAGMRLPGNPYRMSRRKIAGAIAGVVAVAAVGGGGYMVKKKFLGKKGALSYARVDIDPERAKPDEMIAAVAGAAHKWRRDAVWWAINVHDVRADGTVDLTGHAAVVTYISPSKVTSLSKKLRRDSIKKFTFGRNKIDYAKKWNATQRWKGVEAPKPSCAVADLVVALNKRGFEGDQKVRISYDPQFQTGAQVPSWRVFSDKPELDGWYSMDDCSLSAPGASK